MHIQPFALAALLALPLVGDVAPESGAGTTYHVEQSVTLSGIPAGSKLVKWWIAIPDDDRFQDVLDFSVPSAPGDWRIVTEPDHGNRFLYLEVPAPATDSLTAKVDFLVRRRPVFIDVDPARVGPITDSHRKLFVDELRQDAPHMAATPEIKAMADTACAMETNVALQVRKLLDAVADYADHYSKDPTKPKCGIGDAGDCMTNRGGCCTDLHSLFIALARSRGIPARMEMGYRLREVNAGKDVDPGYRCWVEYFLPGYGWVPADIVEADAPDGLGRTRWFSGLTERRVWLDEGRELDLAGRAATHKVNTMVVGYAEIDGVEARVIPDGDKPAQLSRMVHYTEVEPVTH